MKLFSLCLFFLLFILKTKADPAPSFEELERRYVVTSIIPPTDIRLTWMGKEKPRESESPKVGDYLVLLSRINARIIGYAEIKEIEDAEALELLARVKIHERQELISNGIEAYKINLSQWDENLMGRSDLLLVGKPNASARYKRLAWMGPLLGDAHALDKGENLLDITSYYARGITPRITLASYMLANIRYPNGIFQYQLVNQEYSAITASYALFLDTDKGYPLHRFKVFSTTSVSPHLLSHTSFSLSYSPTRYRDVSLRKRFLSTELISIFQYIQDDWDRIIFGPSYDFDQRTVGGEAAYMWIWDHLHFLFGVKTKNIVDIQNWDPKTGYSLTSSLFWRF